MARIPESADRPGPLAAPQSPRFGVAAEVLGRAADTTSKLFEIRFAEKQQRELDNNYIEFQTEIDEGVIAAQNGNQVDGLADTFKDDFGNRLRERANTFTTTKKAQELFMQRGTGLLNRANLQVAGLQLTREKKRASAETAVAAEGIVKHSLVMGLEELPISRENVRNLFTNQEAILRISPEESERRGNIVIAHMEEAKVRQLIADQQWNVLEQVLDPEDPTFTHLDAAKREMFRGAAKSHQQVEFANERLQDLLADPLKWNDGDVDRWEAGGDVTSQQGTGIKRQIQRGRKAYLEAAGSMQRYIGIVQNSHRGLGANLKDPKDIEAIDQNWMKLPGPPLDEQGNPKPFDALDRDWFRRAVDVGATTGRFPGQAIDQIINLVAIDGVPDADKIAAAFLYDQLSGRGVPLVDQQFAARGGSGVSQLARELRTAYTAQPTEVEGDPFFQAPFRSETRTDGGQFAKAVTEARMVRDRRMGLSPDEVNAMLNAELGFQTTDRDTLLLRPFADRARLYIDGKLRHHPAAIMIDVHHPGGYQPGIVDTITNTKLTLEDLMEQAGTKGFNDFPGRMQQQIYEHFRHNLLVDKEPLEAWRHAMQVGMESYGLTRFGDLGTDKPVWQEFPFEWNFHGQLTYPQIANATTQVMKNQVERVLGFNLRDIASETSTWLERFDAIMIEALGRKDAYNEESFRSRLVEQGIVGAALDTMVDFANVLVHTPDAAILTSLGFGDINSAKVMGRVLADSLNYEGVTEDVVTEGPVGFGGGSFLMAGKHTMEYVRGLAADTARGVRARPRDVGEGGQVGIDIPMSLDDPDWTNYLAGLSTATPHIRFKLRLDQASRIEATPRYGISLDTRNGEMWIPDWDENGRLRQWTFSPQEYSEFQEKIDLDQERVGRANKLKTDLSAMSVGNVGYFNPDGALNPDNRERVEALRRAIGTAEKLGDLGGDKLGDDFFTLLRTDPEAAEAMVLKMHRDDLRRMEGFEDGPGRSPWDGPDDDLYGTGR